MGFLKQLFGRRENEEQRLQKQVNTLYKQIVQILEVEMFRRCIQIAEERFPGRDPDPVAAHIKIYCTGEGENERSLAASTAEDRAIAMDLAQEIMALQVAGLYGVHPERVVEIVQGLPESLASVRRLALCYDQCASILMASIATDVSNPLMPAINRDYIREKALPLLVWAESHDPDSAILQTTIAQTYYTLNDIDRGLQAADRATELDSSNAEAWRLVGNGHLGKGNDEYARRCYLRALDLNPNIDGVRQALALLS